MNNAQLKYAKERLEAAKNDKLNLVPRWWGYDADTKADLYQRGEYAVVEKKNGSYVLEWTGEEEKKAEFNIQREAIEKSYRAALDQLMLGDVEEALALINKFIGE